MLVPGERRSLASLPGDILLAIIAYVARRNESRQPYAKTVSRIEALPHLSSWRLGGEHPLIPLSMTCARLRALCAPVMFKHLLAHSEALKRSPFPLNVLAHYRMIYLPDSNYADEIKAILLAMTNLRELVLRGSNYSDLLSAFFTHPTVTNITLRDPSFITGTRKPPTARGLRAFKIFYVSSKWSRATILAGDLRAERDFILSQILPNRQSLEELVLSVDTTRLAPLADAPWPALLELTLAGQYSQSTESVHLVDVLVQLPRLRVLVLAVAPRRGEAALYIWPPQVVPARPPPLSNLRRFSWSFARDDDCVFEHLPPGLIELALRDSPRAYDLSLGRRTGRGDPAAGGYAASLPLLRFSGAARIFSVIPTQPSLVRLELVIQAGSSDLDTAEEATYARAAEVCPNLRVLELHRYRAAEARSVPVAAIVEALAACSHLRELRLNLDFPQLGYFPGGTMSDSHFIVDDDKMAPIYYAAANMAGVGMPWLERIAFLELSPARSFYWTAWSVRMSSEGTVLIEKEPFLNDKLDMSWI